MAEGETKASDIVRKFQRLSRTLQIQQLSNHFQFSLLYRPDLNFVFFLNVCNNPEPVMLTRLEVLLILNLTNL